VPQAKAKHRVSRRYQAAGTATHETKGAGRLVTLRAPLTAHRSRLP
jgi:hypothetical protein